MAPIFFISCTDRLDKAVKLFPKNFHIVVEGLVKILQKGMRKLHEHKVKEEAEYLLDLNSEFLKNIIAIAIKKNKKRENEFIHSPFFFIFY